MATSIKHSGFKRILDRNPTLAILVNGAEVVAYTKDSAGVYALQKTGLAYEALANIVDGTAVSLATGYGAASSNRNYAFEIHADTGSTDLTGDTMVGAIRGRTVVGTTQTNCSLHGIQGNIDVGTVSFQGNIFAVTGVMDCYGSTTMGSGAAFYGGAANFTIWNEATTTVGAGGVWAGVDILQNSGKPTLGSGAINPAIHIRSSASGTAWGHGIYVKASSATTGMYIGTCTTGINIEGTVTLALGIGSTTALTTATTALNAVKVQSNFSGTASTYHIANFFISQYTSTGTGSLRSVVGQVDFSGTQTTASTAQYLTGIHGRAKVSGTVYNSALVVAGVTAQLLAGGTWTAANLVYCLWVDNQLATNPTAGRVAMVGIRQNNNSGTAIVDYVFDIYGAVIARFANFDSCISGGFITASSSAGTLSHKIKCHVDGTDMFLYGYSS